MRKALLLILALALAVTTVMALAEDGTEVPTTPPAVTEEATPDTTETPEAPEETETTEEPEETETTEEPEETEPVEAEETATTEPADTETPEETETAEPTAEATEEPTAEPSEEPTEEPTPEPSATPTVDPNAVPLGEANRLGDVGIMAVEEPDYVVTFPTKVVLTGINGNGTFTYHLKFGKTDEKETSVIYIKAFSHNGWKLLNEYGDEIPYALGERYIRDGEDAKHDAIGLDENRERDSSVDVVLDALDTRKLTGKFQDQLTFTVHAKLREPPSGDLPDPEQPGIEDGN